MMPTNRQMIHEALQEVTGLLASQSLLERDRDMLQELQRRFEQLLQDRAKPAKG